MARWQAQVRIRLKEGVLDPQGEAVAGTLRGLGYEGLGGVRVGKWIEIELEAEDARAAEQQVSAMCQQLLANPVLERYDVIVSEAGRPA